MGAGLVRCAFHCGVANARMNTALQVRITQTPLCKFEVFAKFKFQKQDNVCIAVDVLVLET